MVATRAAEDLFRQDGWSWTWALLGSVLLHLLLLTASGLWRAVDLARQLEAQFKPRIVVLYPGVRTYVPTEAVQAVPAPIEENAPLIAERATEAANPERTAEVTEEMPLLPGTQQRYLSSRDTADGTVVTLPLPAAAALAAAPGQAGAAEAAAGAAGEPESLRDQAADAESAPEAAAAAPVGEGAAGERAAAEPAPEGPPDAQGAVPAAPSPDAPGAASLETDVPEDSGMVPATMAAGGPELPDSRTRQERLSVDRLGIAAFEVSESAWGPYVKEVRDRIGREWLAIVRSRFVGERMGRVTLRFDILADGRVTGIEAEENTAGAMPEAWCVQAVEEAAPFRPFPETFRSEFHRDRKTIHFTFHY